MTDVEPEEEQEPQLPEGDLEHYTDEWVAVRHGRVVAHHPDEAALRADPTVRDGDDIYPIGEPPSGFYMINV